VCRIEARKPRRRGVLSVEFNKPLSTPQTTIEAILHCVRKRGIEALGEPANQERLSRCDGAAKAQIKVRIAKMESSKSPNK
jgi:hypothetical protein